MELKHIKELMASMARTGTKKLQIKQEGSFELTLERHEIGRPIDVELYEESHKLQFPRAEHALPPSVTPPVPVQPESAKQDTKGIFITAPMVGTFYTGPSPDDPVFVKPGDKVEKSTIVCIIEAMKVMNEIKSNVNGTIAEILVESGQPVEFGTKLFRVIE